MRGHDAFEALAGALALDEATPEERAAFAAHAAGCANCRADAADAETVARALAAARDEERWRASLDHLVVGRIRDARARRSTVTLGALGWAVAASIVLNVAVATGFTGRLASAFRDSGEPRSGVVATRLVFEVRSRAERRRAIRVPAPAAALRSSKAPPDVLAGFNVDRPAAARTIAFGTPPACGDATLRVPATRCAPERFSRP